MTLAIQQLWRPPSEPPPNVAATGVASKYRTASRGPRLLQLLCEIQLHEEAEAPEPIAELGKGRTGARLLPPRTSSPRACRAPKWGQLGATAAGRRMRRRRPLGADLGRLGPSRFRRLYSRPCSPDRHSERSTSPPLSPAQKYAPVRSQLRLAARLAPTNQTCAPQMQFVPDLPSVTAASEFCLLRI